MLVVAGWKWPLCPDSTEGIYVLTCMITCIPGTWHHARRRHATMLSREFLSSGRFKEASCDVSSLFVACINAAVSRASWSLRPFMHPLLFYTHSRDGIRLRDAARSHPSYATEEDMFVLVLPFFQRGTRPAQHKGWHDARMKLAGSSGQRVFQPPKHKTLNLSPRARAMVWPCVQRLAPSPAQRIGRSR